MGHCKVMLYNFCVTLSLGGHPTRCFLPVHPFVRWVRQTDEQAESNV